MTGSIVVFRTSIEWRQRKCSGVELRDDERESSGLIHWRAVEGIREVNDVGMGEAVEEGEGEGGGGRKEGGKEGRKRMVGERIWGTQNR
jgi:hypothetical protein